MIYDLCSTDEKELKPYKGYQISKVWDTYKGKAIPGTTVYCIYDSENDAVGDCCKTLKDAHRYIDLMTK